jgi:hypothetical protein
MPLIILAFGIFFRSKDLQKIKNCYGNNFGLGGATIK